MSGKIHVSRIDRQSDGGLFVVFQQDGKNIPIIFPPSMLKNPAEIDGNRFLIWAAQAPFDWTKIGPSIPPVLVAAALLDDLETALKKA